VGKRGGRTVSAPALFFHSIQRGNLDARSSAMDSLVSTARWRGVSPSALREMPESSWPEEMRNSYDRATASATSSGL